MLLYCRQRGELTDRWSDEAAAQSLEMRSNLGLAQKSLLMMMLRVWHPQEESCVTALTQIQAG